MHILASVRFREEDSGIWSTSGEVETQGLFLFLFFYFYFVLAGSLILACRIITL